MPRLHQCHRDPDGSTLAFRAVAVALVRSPSGRRTCRAMWSRPLLVASYPLGVGHLPTNTPYGYEGAVGVMTMLVREGRRERFDRAGGNAVMLSAGHLALDVLTGSIAVLLPTLQRRFDLDAAEVALLVGIELIAASLAQPLLGALADRFGHPGRRSLAGCRRVLVSTLALTPSVPVLLAALVGGGLASAAFHPAANAVARRSASGRAGEIAVGTVGAAGMLGVAVGPAAVRGAPARHRRSGAGPGVGAARDRDAPAHALNRRLVRPARCPLGAAARRGLAAQSPHPAAGGSGDSEQSRFHDGCQQSPAVWLVSAHGMAPDAPLIGSVSPWCSAERRWAGSWLSSARTGTGGDRITSDLQQPDRG